MPSLDESVRGLQRGLRVLDAVLRAPGDGLRVVDLVATSGLGRATVHRLLDTLLDEGYLARNGRFRYVAGERAAPLVEAPMPSAIALKLRPVLDRISSECGDASFAAVREGALSHTIARSIGTWPVQMLSVQVGTRQPLGVGAAGLALLSALPPEECARLIEENRSLLVRFGGMTRTRLDILTRSARERGWAVVGNHAVRGALGVGVVVSGADGLPLAGISVAASIARMTKERQREIAGRMRDALAQMLPKGL